MSRWWLAIAVAGAAVLPGVPAAVAQDDHAELPAVILVVDASGSMNEPSGAGGTRMDAAVEAFAEVVDALPADIQVGLRVFGGSPEGSSCDETRLEVPVAPVDGDALNSAISALEPEGSTPLTLSLEDAAGDLPEGSPGMIIVVTDGEESCDRDPCEMAGQLAASGIDVRIDVVGFQVASGAHKQLACVADAGGGTYYDAPDSAALAAALQRLAIRGLRVFTPSGLPVEGTPMAAAAPAIDAGRYLDELRGDEPKHYQTDVPEGATLWVAATVKPQLASATDRADIGVEVTSASGSRCDAHTMQAVGASARALPLTAAVVVTGDGLAACGDGPYVIKVEQAVNDADEEKAVELLVSHEAAVADTDGIPPPAGDPDWDAEPTTTSAEPEPVIGSSNIASATIVQPGRYSDTILVGETLFYGVELDWGQQLVCTATLGASSVFASGIGSPPPVTRTHMYGPFRGELSGPGYVGGGAFYDGTEDVASTSTTPPVRYLNRDQRQPRHAAVAGRYYCAVKLTGNPRGAGAGEVPLDLVIDVVGTAGEGAPEYVAEPEPEPEPTDAPETAPAEPAGAEQDDATGSSGPPPWLWVAIAAAALALAAVVLVVLVRRRGSGSVG